MIRFISLLLLLIISLLTPFYISMFGALIYVFLFGSLEIIFLAACIDIYYGGPTIIPYYSITAIVMVVLVEYIRPSLMVGNKENEIFKA